MNTTDHIYFVEGFYTIYADGFSVYVGGMYEYMQNGSAFSCLYQRTIKLIENVATIFCLDRVRTF